MTCALERLGGCGGRLEWDHVVKQQRIRQQFPYGAMLGRADAAWALTRQDSIAIPNPDVTLSEILGDTRNRRWLCSRHHELVTNARVDAPVPASVWEFAREFGLDAQLENDIARRAA